MTNTTVTQKEGGVLVQPAGDIVASTVPELRIALRGALGEGARELTIDLSRTQMIDSTGIGLLISAHNSMRKTGGRLAVIHASSEILDLFRAMRIHQHFGVSGE
jgi:anti-anti-sigma factor